MQEERKKNNIFLHFKLINYVQVRIEKIKMRVLRKQFVNYAMIFYSRERFRCFLKNKKDFKC